MVRGMRTVSLFGRLDVMQDAEVAEDLFDHLTLVRQVLPFLCSSVRVCNRGLGLGFRVRVRPLGFRVWVR
jgi:hypothetical protein